MQRRFWIKQSVFGWWVAFNPDEPLALMDTHTYYRSISRDRLIAKMYEKLTPQPLEWEVIEVDDADRLHRAP